MKKKVEPTPPATSRRILKAMWDKVCVYSCADGTFRIEPKWKKRYGKLGPGMLSRMAAAYYVERVLNMPRYNKRFKIPDLKYAARLPQPSSEEK